ncbi:MAG: nitroreductase family protein [Eubacteriaceae bacterium]
MIEINQEKCVGCGLCVKDCFPLDIKMDDKKAKAQNRTCIKCGHCVAICPQKAVSITDYDMEEVVEYDQETFDISSEKLLNFIKYRRSVRQFKDTPIEREKLEKIIEAGRFTPSGSNRQPLSFVVVEREIQELTGLALESLNALGDEVLEDPKSTPLFKNYGLRWKKWYEDYLKNPEEMTSLFFNAKAVIIIKSDSPIDGGLAGSTMELMTNAQGLGMFYSGFFVRAANRSEKIKRFLELNENEGVIACLVIGYPQIVYQRTVPRKKPMISWK